jgi:hypothetical protein
MASAHRRHVQLAVRPGRFSLETGPAGLRPPNLRIHVFAFLWVIFMVLCTHAVAGAGVAKAAVLIPFWAAAVFLVVFAVRRAWKTTRLELSGERGTLEWSYGPWRGRAELETRRIEVVRPPASAGTDVLLLSDGRRRYAILEGFEGPAQDRIARDLEKWLEEAKKQRRAT